MSDRDQSDKPRTRKRRGLFGGPEDSLMQGLTPMPRRKKRTPPPIVPALPSPELTGPLPGLEDGDLVEPGDVLEVKQDEPPGFVPVQLPPEDHSGFTEPEYGILDQAGMFEEEYDTLPSHPQSTWDEEMDTELARPPSDEVYDFVEDSVDEDVDDPASEDSSVDFVPRPGIRVETTGPKLQIRIPPPDRRAEGLGNRYDHEGWASGEGNEDNVSVFEEHSDDSLFNLVAGRQREDFDDPPSDVIEFGPLPRGRVVVKGEDSFSNEEGPRGEADAEVWKDDRDRQLPTKRTSRPRAWWETGPAQAPELPEKKSSWETPDKAPDFRGATRDDRERAARRSTLLRVGAVLFAFVLIAGLALSKLGEDAPVEPETTAEVPVEAPAEEAPEEATPELVEPVEEPPEEAVAEVEVVVEEPPEVPEEPEIVEPPTVVQEAAAAPPEPEQPSIAATAESEEAARQAIYETGILVVKSEPRALIYVDGRRRGYTPVEGLELQPGNHLVKAVVPGRAPKYSQVRVDPGGAHVVPFTF